MSRSALATTKMTLTTPQLRLRTSVRSKPRPLQRPPLVGTWARARLWQQRQPLPNHAHKACHRSEPRHPGSQRHPQPRLVSRLLPLQRWLPHNRQQLRRMQHLRQLSLLQLRLIQLAADPRPRQRVKADARRSPAVALACRFDSLLPQRQAMQKARLAPVVMNVGER